MQMSNSCEHAGLCNVKLHAVVRGHAAPGIKQKAISVWLIPTKYVDCESERWQKNFMLWNFGVSN
jgi:hypothetical protein